MPPCPTIEELESGLAAGAATDELREHLDACPKCRRRAERIADNNRFLADLRTVGAPLDPASTVGPDAAAALAVPLVPGYELQRELHRGGQGVVYLARQTAARRTVAVKMLLSADLATSRQRRRFEREIEIAAGLRHPGIVTLFESGRATDGRHWFAMEYVDGLTFDQYVRQQRPPLADLLRLLADVCDAVNYAHQRGVMHRDLKPANILVDADGRPHVLDFGLAKSAADESAESLRSTTQAGEFMGTFAYAAPEQFRGAAEQVDTRADVYALGAILYEAATGRHPFSASGPLAEFIRNVDQREITRPAALVRGLSAELDAVIMCALAREPARRYQSAGSLRDDLQRCLAGEPVEARRDSRFYLLRKAAHRHRLALGAAAALLLVASAFAVTMGVQARRVAQQRDRAQLAEQEASRAAESLAAALRDSNVERARLLARSGNMPLAERVLWREWLASRRGGVGDALPDDDAYWALWELYAASPCIQTLAAAEADDPGLKAAIRMAVSRDGELLACGAADGVPRLRRAADVAPVRMLDRALAGAVGVAFSPDATCLAAGDESGWIALFDVATGALLRRFQVSTTPVRQVRFTGDGQALVGLVSPYNICAWNLDGRRIEIPLSETDQVRSVDADPAGRRAAFGGDGQTAVVIDLDGRAPPVRFPPADLPRQAITCVGFARDGQSLAIGRLDGSIELWEIAGPRRIWRRRPHRASVMVLAFSPDGTRLASGGWDHVIHYCDFADGRDLGTLTGHSGVLVDLAFLRSGDQLVSSALDGRIKLWNLADHPRRRSLLNMERTVFGVCFSPDGARLAACAAGGATPIVVRDWPAAGSDAGRVVLAGHHGIVSSAAFSPDGSLLATGGYDREVRVWRLSDGECRFVLRGHGNYVESVAFCLDGRRLASAADDGTLRLWDVASGRCAHILRGHDGRVPSLAVTPDGRTVASCGSDGTVRLWSATDGRTLRVLGGRSGVLRAVCFTPDGGRLLSSGDDNLIVIWDVRSGQRVGALEGSEHAAYAIAVSPDGRFAASATRGGSVQLWSLERRRSLATLAEDGFALFTIAFSRDGRSLVYGGESGQVKQLDLASVDAYLEGNRGVQGGDANVRTTAAAN